MNTKIFYLEKEREKAQHSLICAYTCYRPEKREIYNVERHYRSIERKIDFELNKMKENGK